MKRLDTTMLILQKSAIDPALYEILDGEEVVKEIPHCLSDL